MTLILFYNKPDHASLSDLSAAEQEAFTSNAVRFAEADAVVFHLPTLGPVAALQKPAGQIWVLWSMESVANYPAMADPALRGLFDLVMTYQRAADVWSPYIPDRAEWDDALRRPLPEKIATVPAVMLQSSAFNRSGRIGYAAELMKAVAIDSFGRILNNRRLPTADRGDATKRATIARYKFCIAFENSICDDYVTEKFFQPLLCGTVPVYLGARNVDAFAPGDDCYIDVRDFSGPRQLGEYLKFLDRDDAAYRRLLAWRDAPLRPSLAADLARRDHPFRMLLRAVEARKAQGAPANDCREALSYDPDRYGVTDPARSTVALEIYDRRGGSERIGLPWLRTLPMRAARRGAAWLRAARRRLP